MPTSEMIKERSVSLIRRSRPAPGRSPSPSSPSSLKRWVLDAVHHRSTVMCCLQRCRINKVGLFAEENRMHDSEAREKGQVQYKELFGKKRKRSEDDTALDEFTLDHLFANVWSRPQLSMPQRSMITVALLAALGRDRELKKHVEGALHQGITHEQIIEIMVQVAHYAGWPAGHNGQRIAQEVFKSALTPKPPCN